jgi:alpha-tubulin suppressor-like RCC1 family protein
MPSASITLYAKWTGNPYSISYSYKTMQAPRFQKLSTGETHSIGLNTNGQVYSWGSNEFGNIGNGTTSFTPTHPTLISFTGLQDGEIIRDVFAGQFHTFSVTSNGRVYAWGLNDVGQLGDNSIVNKLTPTLISFTGLQDGETIRNVVADESHSLAVTTTGRVYSWGRNSSGQLGDNTLVAKRIPTLISFTGLQDGETIKNVAAGGDSSFTGGGHSLAVTTIGRVYAWGKNNFGQLGDTTTVVKRIPTLISFPDGVTIDNVTAGGEYSHAVTSTGQVYSWGYNNLGQLGDGTTENKSTPTLISFNGLGSGETIRNVHIGTYHSLAVTTIGRVYSWGYNYIGQLGDGTTENKSSPTLISFTGLEDGETVRDVFSGSAHSLAVTTNNRLYAWGYNPFGQHGD